MIKISLAGFSDEAGNSVQEQITALKMNGIRYVELRSIDKTNVLEFTENQSKEYYKQFVEQGIQVWALGSPLGKDDISIGKDALLDKAKRLFATANIFHTDKIRVFSFFNAYNQKEKVMEYLRLLVEKAKEYGVTLCHENEKEVYGDVKERVKELMDNVSGLKFVYDPANYLQVGEQAEETLNAFHAESEYFHIKDVLVSTDELVPAGHGDGRIQELINRIDRDVTLTLEPHLAVFDSFKSIDNTQMKHKFYFENNLSAFNFAANALKKLLMNAGYKEENGLFIK